MKNKKIDYKRLLIFKNSPLSEEIQLKMIDSLFSVFIQHNKDMLFLNEGKIGKVSSRKAFETMAYMYLNSNFEDSPKTYDEEKKSYKWALKISDIYDTLTVINSYELIEYKSDLFAEKQTIEKNEITKTITVTLNKIHILKQEEPNISFDVYNEIKNDYLEHFPFFDDLLTLIIDMRLAKNRKASFLHLRVKSNWGKSFLSGILQELQIGFEIDYHNIMDKGANDIYPIQVRNSFVLLLDEFNNFSMEMKKLSHDFKFAPKFGMKEKVELYLKILMSAEKSPSFSGGVDEQIINRIMVMDIADKDAKRLTDREVYKKHGNALYMDVLKHYSYIVLSEHLKLYLSMNKFDAHKTADEEVLRRLEELKMENVENLNDETREIINESIKDIIYSNIEDLIPQYRAIKDKIITIEQGEYKGKIFIRQPKRTIEIILKNSVGEGDYKKMKWKLSDISEIITLISSKPMFLYGRTMKGVVIDIEPKKNHLEIIEDLRKSGNLIED